MAFTSATFLLFHVCVVLLRWVVPKSWVAPLLLLSSYAFYLSWGVRYGLLLFGLSAAGFGLGLLVERTPLTRKRVWLIGSVVGLLAPLVYFKYAAFFAAQIAQLVVLFGAGSLSVPAGIVLPLGISFFTFEVISYVIDVARGEVAERSFTRFALYVAYYPHLVAGPLVRAHELLPALREQPGFDAERFCEGVFVALVGLLKKMVLADNLAHAADTIFASPGRYQSGAVWLGVLAYAGQIYCDFSGYTDIARGTSAMLGYDLPRNFDAPYLARSISEFWRRWHMTLSRWLRDYLYISLGGNRHGVVRQYRNLFLTMLLGGLWHGASWTFVAWGAGHGALLALHKGWTTLWPAAHGGKALIHMRGVAGWCLTELAVVLLWVFFRAPNFENARMVFARLFSGLLGTGPMGTEPLPDASRFYWAFAAFALLHALAPWQLGLRAHRRLPSALRGLVWSCLFATCYVLAETRASFIYFQF